MDLFYQKGEAAGLTVVSRTGMLRDDKGERYRWLGSQRDTKERVKWPVSCNGLDTERIISGKATTTRHEGYIGTSELNFESLIYSQMSAEFSFVHSVPRM
jgi:hypothetical protein